MTTVESSDVPRFDVEKAEHTSTAAELSAAQRARIERNRLRARQLRDARLVARPNVCERIPAPIAATDSGGGFIPEEEESTLPVRAVPQPAPIVDPTERPQCLECDQLFPESYLFDTFGYNVCDECRDDEGAHDLITRTEAKNTFLLKDCDLDLRPPPLRFVRRRNPHGSRLGDMRLYLRAQVEARARLVWGSDEALEEERARREEARVRARHTQTSKRLRALRMDVRSSLFDKSRAVHEHTFGEEKYDEASDLYSRSCACGHTETYEKM